MNHFRPHLFPRPTFEGYYSKFDLPSGAKIALVICSVPNSNTRPHMVSFTYVPSNYPKTPLFQREIWVDDIQTLDQPCPSSLPPKPNSDDNNNHSPSKLDLISNQEQTESPIAFHLHIPDVGYMTVYTDHSTVYDITDPKGLFEFTANVPSSTASTSNRTPWSRLSPTSTPEGLLIHLPLPLHWHVHSLSSPCTFNLSISPSSSSSTSYRHLHPLDQPSPSPSPSPSSRSSSPDHNHNNDNNITLPTAHVHQEKNWAHSFPTSHVWIQAHKPSTRSGIALAGGSILSTQSYLLTYHGIDSAHDVSFTPPYSMALSIPTAFRNPKDKDKDKETMQISPTLSVSTSWTNTPSEKCTFSLTVSSITRKICITAHAPRETFFGLSAPFDNGHRLNFLGQSFSAEVRVQVFRATRGGLGHWEMLCDESFEGASLEFGGDEYGSLDKGREMGGEEV